MNKLFFILELFLKGSMDFLKKIFKTSSNSDHWLQEGRRYLVMKDFLNAKSCFKKYLQENPEDKDIWIELIKVDTMQVDRNYAVPAHYSGGKLDSALKSCNEALKFLPNDIDILRLKSDCLNCYDDRYTEALECNQLLMSLGVKDLDLLQNTVKYMERLGRRSEAVELYNSIIVEYPNDYKAYWQGGRLLRENQQFSDALELYEKLMKIDKNEGLWGKIHTYKDMKQWDKGIQCLDQLSPKNTEEEHKIYEGKAYFLRELGRYREALVFAELDLKNCGLDNLSECDFVVRHLKQLIEKEGK